MKRMRMDFAVAALACSAMLVSPVAMAAQAAPVKMAPTDISLRDGGVLVGQIVSTQGAAVAAAPVSIVRDGRQVIRVATNAKGEFTVAGMKGGVYQISAPGHQGVYRLWAPRTAPPVASNGLMAVVGNQAVLGQYGPPVVVGPPVGTGVAGGPFASVTGWIAKHPIMTAGIIATAVVVPVVIDDDNDAS